MEIIGFSILGAINGTLSGFLGIGGAMIIIPVLVYIFGFDQKTAQCTTLLLMLPPIGLFAALEYHKAGFTNIKAGIFIAIFFIIGSWISSKFAVKLNPDIIRKIFACSLMLISIRMFFK